MTSKTPGKSTVFIWTPVRKICATLLTVLFVLCIPGVLDRQTIFVRDEHIATLAALARLGSCTSIIAGLVLAWGKHQTYHLPNLFYAACGYVLVILVCLMIGGSAVFTIVPRVSIFFTSSPVSVHEDLHQVQENKPSHRLITRTIEQTIWRLKYGSSTIYSLRFDPPRVTPFYEQQSIHMTDHYGFRVGSSGLCYADPPPVILQGIGNSFAIRVLDISIPETPDN